MKKEICINEFKSFFANTGYSKRFSNNGLNRLFEILDDIEQETGCGYGDDIAAICCGYRESNISELRNNYGYMFDDEISDSELISKLEDKTSVYNVNKDIFIINIF